MKLPAILYVTVEELPNEEVLAAHSTMRVAMADSDGPTVVGTYHLVETATLTKKLVVQTRTPTPKKRKRTKARTR